MSDSPNKYILNLAQELTESLAKYFEKNSFELMTRGTASNYEQLDYIIVDTAEEARNASKDFNTDANEIVIVCLGKVKEMRDFLLNNGRLSIDPVFAESKLGEQILNKFFKKNYNIHLDESYSDLFSEPNEFKITNHLSSGIYIDELCVNAFENGFNIVSLRSFMDHAIYYFTYLKQAGLAGVPYEVEYANNDDFYVVNIYLPVRNFVAEYMIDSFGPVNAKDPLQYLLGIVARSTDFLEVTYVENPGRLVLTAAWGKNEKKKIGGIAFNSIQTTAQTIAQLDKKVKEYREVEDEIKENEQKEESLQPKSLPGGILEMVVSKDENSILSKQPQTASNIVAFAVAIFEEQHPDRSINDIDEEEFSQIISDYQDEDVIAQLSDDDREHLLDKIQKNSITDAYDEELQRVRDSLEDEDDFKKELQNTMTEEVSKRVAGHLDAEVLNKILGSKDKDDWKTKVSGGDDDPDDFVARISGMDKKKESPFVQMISSSFEKKAGEFNVNISGSSDPNEKKGLMRNMINSTVDDIKSFDNNMMSSSVKQFAQKNVPKNIEIGMEKYAQRMGKVFENLSMEEIEDFQQNELPSIIENTLSDEEQIAQFRQELEKTARENATREEDSVFGNMSPEFEEKFRGKLEEKLDELDFVEKVDNKFVVTDNQVGEEKMQEIIQQTMKDTMDDEFQLDKATKEEIEEKEQKIIEDLSSTLNVDKEEMSEIVKGGTKVAKEKELQTVVDSLFKDQPGEQEEKVVIGDKEFGKTDEKEDKSIVKDSSDEKKLNSENKNQAVKNSKDEKVSNLAEAELIKKLKKSEAEKKKLANSIKVLETKLGAKDEVDQKVKDINDEAKGVAEKEEDKINKDSSFSKTSVEDKAEAVVEDLKAGKDIGDDGKEALAALLAREKEILSKAKLIETDLKKSQIEANQKEALFKSEVDKLSRTMKGKDMVIEKAKESMKGIVTKKDKEISDLVSQLENMNRRLEGDASTKLATQVKSLQGDNERLAKSAEMFKNRLDAFTKSKKALAEADNSKAIADENRMLKSAKTQLENKMNAALKETKSWESRFNKIKELETRYRTESTQYKTKSSELESKIKTLKENEARLTVLANKAQSQGGSKKESTGEVDALKLQNSQLQAKLKEIIEKQKSGGAASGAGSASAKEKHLEKEKKNLQAQASKARTEAEAMRKDMMKMKGEQTKLQNEIKKLKKDLERSGAGAKGKSAKKAA